MKIKRKNLIKSLFIFLAVICFISLFTYQNSAKSISASGSPANEIQGLTEVPLVIAGDLKEMEF